MGILIDGLISALKMKSLVNNQKTTTPTTTTTVAPKLSLPKLTAMDEGAFDAGAAITKNAPTKTTKTVVDTMGQTYQVPVEEATPYGTTLSGMKPTVDTMGQNITGALTADSFKGLPFNLDVTTESDPVKLVDTFLSGGYGDYGLADLPLLYRTRTVDDDVRLSSYAGWNFEDTSSKGFQIWDKWVKAAQSMSEAEFLKMNSSMSKEDKAVILAILDTYGIEGIPALNMEPQDLNYYRIITDSEDKYGTTVPAKFNDALQVWWLIHNAMKGSPTGTGDGSGYGYGGYGGYGGGGGGGGGGGEDTTTTSTWTKFDYTVPGAPSWWQALKPSTLTTQSQYLSMLNMMIPYLSVEDQQTIAKYLYAADPVAFAIYDPLLITSASGIPTQVTSDMTKQYMGSDRATSAMEALNALMSAMGKSEEDLGPGYRFLKNILASMKAFGSSGTDTITRSQYAQLMGALDPLLSGAKSSDETSPYAPLAQMLAQPFFSAGKLMNASQDSNGKWYFGAPNPQLYF